MALKHHWKFNGNLQDAVGDLHLTNVVGTPAYTSNKDGVANSCVDNSSKWHAYSDNTTEFSDAQRSYSLWIQTPSPSSSYCVIYQDKMYVFLTFSNNLEVHYRDSESWSSSTVLSVPMTSVENEWLHVCITINNSGVKKLFINGILKSIKTNSISPRDSMRDSGASINAGRNPRYPNPNLKSVDEIKYFDHILTDGGVTTVGQAASVNSEVWLLYLDGVNNRPRYTLNEATNVTATTATVSWTK